MLISAIFDCELAWNFQGDTSFDCINDCSQIDIVHPYIGKTPHRKTRTLLESDLVWIETNLSTMWSLLDLEISAMRSCPYGIERYSTQAVKWQSYGRQLKVCSILKVNCPFDLAYTYRFS
jgi:hypothetical protein